MDNASKETLCSHCVHRVVCTYSDDYLSILKAVSEAYVSQPCSNGDGLGYKKVINFDFIGDISVACRYYQNINNVKYIKESPLGCKEIR